MLTLSTLIPLLIIQSPIQAETNTRSTSGKFGDSKIHLSTTLPPQTFATLNGKLVWKEFLTSETFPSDLPNISANWFADCVDDNGSTLILASSFRDKSARLYRIDEETVEFMSLVHADDDTLRIDPTIIKTDHGYFATLTEIRGAINNSQPDIKNGNYQVILLRSNDLIKWKKINTIINEDTNIEDGSLLIDSSSKNMFFVYESEVLDKGNSAIKLTQSEDKGLTWNAPKTIISTNADNEPASVILSNKSLTLFFSSDIEKRGGSYESAKAYCANYSLTTLDQLSLFEIPEMGESILLMDVVKEKQNLYILGIRNYLTAPTLIEVTLK